MKWRLVTTALMVVAVMPGQAPAQPASPQARAVSERDPAAMAALNRMGTALRQHMTIGVHVDITTEDVLRNGQKLQFGGTGDILASRPDKLKMRLIVGQGERQVYYDGHNLTLYSPQQNVYAVFGAPPTIRQTLEVAANEYGLEIPLADMFFWGDDKDLEARVLSAFPVGKEVIGGQICDHFAVRQEMVDWQIWIRETDDALPCKLVITNTLDPAMPQYTAVYTWVVAPTVDPAAFTFKAPAEANKIIFGTLKNKQPSPGK